ncbi:hypothetical protein Pcinc_043861 [Petrolisthes cinctipes]|uniref:Uncharacterized protein n=1 Tax=Petrolisthes cinctipes TaxID=88211 RepID=A0AAE1BGY1_PETCI|nr:hypothetical protein Pcinc_043861 [Petrolisthes cinctipes]
MKVQTKHASVHSLHHEQTTKCLEDIPRKSPETLSIDTKDVVHPNSDKLVHNIKTQCQDFVKRLEDIPISFYEHIRKHIMKEDASHQLEKSKLHNSSSKETTLLIR